MKIFYKLIVAAIAVPLLFSQAFALTVPAITTLTNPPGGYNYNAGVRGWGFTALSSFDIVALGLADLDNTVPPGWQLPGDVPGAGFATAHSVILWDSAGAQLASVTVKAGTASPVGPGNISGSSVFRYENLASAVTLTAGESYIISAFFQRYSNDRVASDPYQGALVFDPRVQSTGLRYGATSTHLFPTTTDSFLFSATSFLIGDTVSAVPIPAALPLFGTGLALMGFVGWRRKRGSAAA